MVLLSFIAFAIIVIGIAVVIAKRRTQKAELLEEFTLHYTLRIHFERDNHSYTIDEFIRREARVKSESLEQAKKKLQERLVNEFSLSFDIED